MSCLPAAMADNHGHKGKNSLQNPFSTSRHGKGDRGDEFTGESAAWIFAAANLPALFSLLVMGIIHNRAISGNLKDRLKRLNQAQKRYLMPFHYILNLLALIVACIHFSLSHCRSTSLPEWSLAVMALLAITGVLIKFKLSPRSMRSSLYQIHTNPLAVGLLVAILLAGHINILG